MFQDLGIVIVDPLLIPLTSMTIEQDYFAASSSIVQTGLVSADLSFFRQHPILISTLYELLLLCDVPISINKYLVVAGVNSYGFMKIILLSC